MDTKALRQKILDLAIRGKLVPQNPNDEPASVLLERIREEKKQMVKDGKLKPKDIKNDTIIFKGEDNLHYEKFQDGTVKCIEDEIPFEIPEGYEWSRIGSIFTTVTGSTPSTKNKDFYGNEYPFYKPTDLDNGYDVFDSSDHVSKEGLEAGRALPQNSVLVTCIGATIGKTGLIHNQGICNQQINAIIPTECMNSDFVFYSMCSDFEQSQIIANASATTLPILNKGRFDSLLFIVPPLSQQNKAAEVVKKLLNYVDELDDDQESLLETVASAKKKVLDLAIRGSLVPQDFNDEPASILLDRIRAEKDDLIKQGKLKRDKKESIIYKGDDNSYYEKFANGEKKNITDEIPFNLPETWQWCRLKHIGNIIGGGTPKTAISDYWDGDIPWITPADLSGYDDIFISSGARNISVIGLNKSSAQLLPKGTVLFSSRAPIGYTAIASNEISTNQGFKSFVPATSEITSKYIYYCLKARYDDIVMRASGTTFKEISGSEMAETLIPLPPQNEQERITEYIVYLNDYISSIEANLS